MCLWRSFPRASYSSFHVLITRYHHSFFHMHMPLNISCDDDCFLKKNSSTPFTIYWSYLYCPHNSLPCHTCCFSVCNHQDNAFATMSALLIHTYILYIFILINYLYDTHCSLQCCTCCPSLLVSYRSQPEGFPNSWEQKKISSIHGLTN